MTNLGLVVGWVER